MTTITLLHPGSMGAAVGAQARGTGATVLWCPAGRGPATRQRAEQASLSAVDELADALARSDVVLSICPPAVAEDVAGQVNACGYRGLYVEANAISPRRAGRIAELLAVTGAVVVDGSIIGPPPGAQAGARLYLSGDPVPVGAMADLFAGTAVRPVVLAGPVGAASALKMAFGSYQKAARTLAAVSHALASEYGVTEALLDEGKRMAAAMLADTDYLPSVAARAWRWAPEMHEAAATFQNAGLPDQLAVAAAAVMQRWTGDRDRFDLELAEVLDHLREPRPPS